MSDKKITALILLFIFLIFYSYVRKKFLVKKNETKGIRKELPEDRIVILAQFSSLDAFDDTKIMDIQSYLSQSDIDSTYDTFVGGDMMNNYHLLVRNGDLEAAKKLLAEYFKHH